MVVVVCVFFYCFQLIDSVVAKRMFFFGDFTQHKPYECFMFSFHFAQNKNGPLYKYA